MARLLLQKKCTQLPQSKKGLHEHIRTGGGCLKRHCSTEEFAFSSIFVYFFGNEKSRCLAGMRRNHENGSKKRKRSYPKGRINSNAFTLILLGSILLLLHSCHYSFTSASVDASITSYYVEQFTNNALNSQPTLAIRLTEDLKEKIRTESRLVYNDLEPQVEFKGVVVAYRVTSEAPQPGEVTSINRLTVTTAVEYINNVNEDKSWKKNFSFFYDFSTDNDLSQIEEEAITEISQQMMEDIFNAAFNDW